MSDLLDDAVEVLRGLPEDLQAAAARAIIDYSSGRDEDLRLSDEQAIEIERRVAHPNRTFISLDEARDHLRPFGV